MEGMVALRSKDTRATGRWQVSAGASPLGTSPGGHAGSGLKGDYAPREGKALLLRLN